MSEFKTTEAAWHLENNQTQMDFEGVMVGVSRQAIDEVLIELTVLRAQAAKTEAKHKAELLAVPDEVIPAILNEFDWATENEIKAIEYGVDTLRDQIKQRIGKE